jgi:hypothetical protein
MRALNSPGGFCHTEATCHYLKYRILKYRRGKALFKIYTDNTSEVPRKKGHAQSRSNTGLSNPDMILFPLYLFPKVKSQGH